MNKVISSFNTLPVSIRYLIIALVGSVLFVPFLGGVHLFDWDEINFAECAREMIRSKDYLRNQIDYSPFWEKPPVFIWMQVLSMQVFGINEFAARFPNVVVGILTLLTIYKAGSKMADSKVAFLWVCMYLVSWLPHFYFRTGIIDPTFNLFIFAAILQIHYLKWEDNKLLHALLAGIFLGIAVLTKGPAALVVVGLMGIVYFIVNRGAVGYNVVQIVVVAVAASLPFILWILAAMLTYGTGYAQWFLSEFVAYQVRLFTTGEADHGGPFYYHFVVLLFGCFPASLFLLNGLIRRSPDQGRSKDFNRLMSIMFWVVLLLFSIVKTKIVHYSSLCYFPLTWLAARRLYQVITTRDYRSLPLRWLRIIGVLSGMLLLLLPVVGMNKQLLIPLLDDPFAVGNLMADVHWSYLDCIWGAGYLAAIIIAVRRMRKNEPAGLVVLMLAQICMIQVAMYAFVQRIEAYSQRAAIEYFESFKGKDVYIAPVGYRSYAYLFYADKQPYKNDNYFVHEQINEEWLLKGAVDKPAYFISKVQDAPRLDTQKNLVRTGEKNGFVFFKRVK